MIIAKAIFAAGCFWGIQNIYEDTPGVISTQVGYIGGQTANPTYQQVSTGTTGHAEAVEVFYDPEQISYDDLLNIFFKSHNPTSLNRQGPDIGTQYRSAIFYVNEEQKSAALQKIQKLEASHYYPQPIVTQVVAAGEFYPAEEYHQKYLLKRGETSCHLDLGL